MYKAVICREMGISVPTINPNCNSLMLKYKLQFTTLFETSVIAKKALLFFSEKSLRSLKTGLFKEGIC